MNDWTKGYNEFGKVFTFNGHSKRKWCQIVKYLVYFEKISTYLSPKEALEALKRIQDEIRDNITCV